MRETRIGEGFRGPEGHIGFLLRQAHQAFDTALADRLRDLGLTARQYSVLSVLDAAGPMSVSELARSAMVSAQSMHETVGALESAGLVTRRPHPDHGRIRLLEVTGSGRDRAREARRRATELEHACLDGLDPAAESAVRVWLVTVAQRTHDEPVDAG